MESSVIRISKKCIESTIVLILVFTKAFGMCPSGYSNIDSNSEFCFMIPFMHNNPENSELHPNDGKTWKEAEEDVTDLKDYESPPKTSYTKPFKKSEVIETYFNQKIYSKWDYYL